MSRPTRADTVVGVGLGLVGDGRGRARRWMAGTCRSTRDLGISVVRMCGALRVDGGEPVCRGMVCGAETKKKKKREMVSRAWRCEEKKDTERQAGLGENKPALYYHLPVRRVRFRRLGVPLRATQSPRLFAYDRFLSLPLSCLGPSRIAKQLLRLAVAREKRKGESSG